MACAGLELALVLLVGEQQVGELLLLGLGHQLAVLLGSAGQHSGGAGSRLAGGSGRGTLAEEVLQLLLLLRLLLSLLLLLLLL